MVGRIIKEFSIGKKKFARAEYRLITSSFMFLLVIRIPVVGIIVGIAYTILVISCSIQLYKTLKEIFG